MEPIRAATAFSTQGLAVPLDEIARLAGVGAGTIYRNFPSKESLFEAVVLSRITDHIELAQELASAEDPGAAFFQFLERMIEDGSDKRDLVDALAGTGVDTSLIAGATKPLNAAIGVLLTRAQQAGVVRRDLTVTDLITLMTAIFMTIQRRHDNTGMRERVWAVIFDGLRAGCADHSASMRLPAGKGSPRSATRDELGADGPAK